MPSQWSCTVLSTFRPIGVCPYLSFFCVHCLHRRKKFIYSKMFNCNMAVHTIIDPKWPSCSWWVVKRQAIKSCNQPIGQLLTLKFRCHVLMPSVNQQASDIQWSHLCHSRFHPLITDPLLTAIRSLCKFELSLLPFWSTWARTIGVIYRNSVGELFDPRMSICRELKAVTELGQIWTWITFTLIQLSPLITLL